MIILWHPELSFTFPIDAKTALHNTAPLITFSLYTVHSATVVPYSGAVGMAVIHNYLTFVMPGYAIPGIRPVQSHAIGNLTQA